MTLAVGLVGTLLLAASGLAGPSDTIATGLAIEIQRAPGLEPERFTLACDPSAGTVSDPARACRRIAALVADAMSGGPISSDWVRVEAAWRS